MRFEFLTYLYYNSATKCYKAQKKHQKTINPQNTRKGGKNEREENRERKREGERAKDEIKRKISRGGKLRGKVEY